jgi:nicotinamidase-related amidase/alkylated DNA repair dioxygenase AlkB/glutathione S-transferase
MVSKMSSLMDLVAQNQPQFQTHQALLVIGLQNDFVLPDGRLPVNLKKGFMERIQALIPKFRELNGNVIWVQTLYEADRIATDANTGEGDALVVGGLIDGDESSTEGGDEELAKDVKDLPPAQSRSAKHKLRALQILKRVSTRIKTIPHEVARSTAEEDDELFLLKSEKKIPACVPNTYGAEFADVIARQFELPADMVIRTTNYSAFQGTNLLMTLRARLVTELYICGCITNVSVLATVIDAARHGVKINVVEDCLGYRKQTRHDLALKRMDEFFDAYMVNSADILAKELPPSPPRQTSSPNGSRKGSKGSDKPIEALMGKMSLGDEARPSSRTSNHRSPTRVLSGKQRTLSLVSVAESRKTSSTNTTTPKVEPVIEAEPPAQTDKQFADMLVQGAILPRAEDDDLPPEEKPKLVKTKIRMRSNQKRRKKKEKEKEAESSKPPSEPPTVSALPTNPSPPPASATPQPTEPRPSLLARVGSIANLRDRDKPSSPSLKTATSVPALHAKSEEKDRNRLSDLSDRVRLSLARAPKSESGSESRRSLGGSSLKLCELLEGKGERERDGGRRGSVKTFDTGGTGTGTGTPTVRGDGGSERGVEGAGLVGRGGEGLVEKGGDALLEKKGEGLVEKMVEENGRVEIAAKVVKLEAPVEPLQSPPKKVEEQPHIPPAAKGVEPEVLPQTTQPPPIPRSNEKPLPATPAKSPELQSLATLPVLGPGDKIGEGDTHIIHDFLPATCHPSPSHIFHKLYSEVQWQKMHHQSGEVPRLVCTQGLFTEDGAMPIYRHPSDQTLPLLHFSPAVQTVRKHAEKVVGHTLNHVLIQLYRSGTDYISEHSDKTLDIAPNSQIVNISFGAQRTMRLRSKKPLPSSTAEVAEDRQTQRVAMPHNSLFSLGLATNRKWLHGIMPDKRPDGLRSDAETAYSGCRISLTFRHIATFVDAKQAVIWGQGATAKQARDAADVVSGDDEEVERLVRAFGRENHDAGFEWEEGYGGGWDVVHLSPTAEGDIPLLFLSGDDVANQQIGICLAEAKVKVQAVPAPELAFAFDGSNGGTVMFRDADTLHTQLASPTSILLYIDRFHPLDSSAHARAHAAAAYAVLPLAEKLAHALQRRRGGEEEVAALLGELEDMLEGNGGPFICGRKFGVGDCAVWPLLHAIAADVNEPGSNPKIGQDGNINGEGEEKGLAGFKGLEEYYRACWKRKGSVKKVVDKLAIPSPQTSNA